MRKLFLFVIATILIAPNAWAFSTEVGTCVNASWTWCWGNCCAPTSAQCMTYCSEVIPVACAGLDCAGVSVWTTDPSNSSREHRCQASTNTCEYRCKTSDGVSRYAQQEGSGSNLRCAQCPDNCNCDGTFTVTGKKNYYPERLPMTMQGVGTVYIATCSACPSYNYLIPVMTGGQQQGWMTGFASGETDSSAVESITECYIPQGRRWRDDTGIYEISGGNCGYLDD